MSIKLNGNCKEMSKTKVKLPKSYLKAIEKIKSKGFSHIKVELEADLRRNESQDERCDSCLEGFNSCEGCNASGYTTETNNIYNFETRQREDEEVEIECIACGGEGSTECDECAGRGWVDSSTWGNDRCCEYILDQLPAPIRRRFNHIHFYNDGSVDSELTFTLPIAHAEDVVKVIRAFNDLADEIGGGTDIHRAGMHITVMTGGRFPTGRRLNAEFIKNFKSEVTKLLPALFFSATHTPYTRGLEFREPKISSDSKYSAIYTRGDTCIEYRLFDLCYDKPEVFYEKMEVIAGTLTYYSNEKADVKYKRFVFSDDTDMREMFNTLPEYDALLKTIKQVKPGSKSFKRMREERGIKITKKSLLAKMRQQMDEMRSGYKVYRSEWKKNQTASVESMSNRTLTCLHGNEQHRISIPLSLIKRPTMGGDWVIDKEGLKVWLIENGDLEKKPMTLQEYHNQEFGSDRYGSYSLQF